MPRVALGVIGTVPKALEAAVAPALIVMDIEGAQTEPLEPDAVPGLARADILVETHDAFVATATETLIARFSTCCTGWRRHQADPSRYRCVQDERGANLLCNAKP